MKKLLIATVALLTVVLAGAQSAKYTEVMKKNLALLDSAKTADDLQNAANNFERIATAEKDQWQPYYYAAYALTMKAFATKEKNAIDAIANKADELASLAESFSKDNSEITTIKSMILTSKLMVDNSRFMTLGPKAAALLQQALQQQPANNPRALMQMAQSKYYTPAAFGGGKEPAIELLKKSIASYATFKPANELDPNWGKEYAEGVLKEWSK